MRSFVCSALFIASLLIGQQWIAKSSQADSTLPSGAARSIALQAGYANWMAGTR